MVTIAMGTRSRQASVEEQIEQIKQQFNISVLYKESQQYIPLLWKIQPGSVSSSSVTIENLQRLIRILPRELKKYPIQILKENISRIFVLGELKFDNIPVGGAYLDKSVYITVNNSRYEDYLKFLTGVFHHELSSILMYHYKLQEESWSIINPTDFSYAKTEEEKLKALDKSSSIDGRDQLYRYGFLTEYNQASLENDFNMYAEFAFSRPDRLEKLAREYPLIRRKVILLKEFYLSISRDFEPVMAVCCNV